MMRAQTSESATPVGAKSEEMHGDVKALFPPGVVPSPPAAPLSLPRYMVRFVRNPLSVMPLSVYEEPIVQHGRRTWVSDPALIKTILLDERESFPKTGIEARVFGGLLGQGILIAEDTAWRWQRQAAAPIFRHAEILQHVPPMARAAERLIAAWRASPPQTLQPIDRQMTEITFDVIAETMLAGAEGARGAGLERMNGDYMRPLAWPLLWAILRLPRTLPFPGRRRHVAAERAMREAVTAIVRTRRREGFCSDLLQRLIKARDPDGGQLMNDGQLTDNLLTFLLAGHETTARSLAWALYLLSLSRKWEALLLAEVRAVAGNSELTGAHVERLPLVTAFIKETMRLYPPISSISRIAARDVMLGGKTVAKGSLVIIPMFAIHRHRKLWTDPDRFDPTRFNRDEEAKLARYQYMPFGAGPRICIGASFSMTESVVMLASFLRAARFATPPGRAFTPVSGISLRAKPNIELNVSVRDGQETL
jgi:cytochrome P450